MPQPENHVMHVWNYVRAGTLALVVLAVAGSSCQENATKARARLADEAIATEICSVWTPITDTTSPQVRGINRARFAFCEGTTMEKAK